MAKERSLHGISRTHTAVRALAIVLGVCLGSQFAYAFSPITGRVTAIKVRTDGKIWVCGPFGGVNGISRPGVALLNANGTLEESFDPALGTSNGSPYAFDLGPDGKVVVGGNSQWAHAGLVRLYPDGAVDDTFAPLLGTFDDVRCLVIQPDLKVVIGGTGTIGVRRLNVDGTIDGSFVVSQPIGTPNSLVLQPDGKLIVGLNGYIRRLNSDGSTDGGFNGYAHAMGPVFSIAVQPDGKIIAAGLYKLRRLNSDGSLDTGFVERNGDFYGVTIQPDGKIVVGGTASDVPGVARLNTDGSPDSTFVARTSGTQFVEVAAVQANGAVLLGGAFQFINGHARACMARVTADGILDDNPPIILSATPDPVLRGDYLEMTGVGLHLTSAVTIGGTPVEVVLASANWVKVRISEAHPRGPNQTIIVTTPEGSGGAYVVAVARPGSHGSGAGGEGACTVCRMRTLAAHLLLVTIVCGFLVRRRLRRAS